MDLLQAKAKLAQLWHNYVEAQLWRINIDIYMFLYVFSENSLLHKGFIIRK